VKIAWLCALNIDVFKDKLEFSKNKYPIIVSPWISILIDELREFDNIELHIISSYRNLKKDTNISHKGVNYYLLSSKIPFINRGYPHIFKHHTKNTFLKSKVKSILKKINPDIVNLHGTENDFAYIISRLNYPKMITIQGLIHNVYKNNPTNYYRHFWELEKKIFKKCSNFGVRAEFMPKLIKKYNKNANFHWFYYPFKKSTEIEFKQPPIKDNDIIFAARICKDKGIEDLIDACSIIKKQIPDLKLKIFGYADESYKGFIIKKINGLGLEKNIKFVGYVNKKEDLYDAFLKSKICVLPTYHDIMPGTIIESLLLGIPVISYMIEGIIDFNKYQEIIKLVEKGNIKSLADQIVELLTNDELRNKIGFRGKDEAISRFDNEVNCRKILEAYRKIINDHKVSKNEY